MDAAGLSSARITKLGTEGVPLCGPALLVVAGGEVRARSFASQDVIRLCSRDVIAVHSGHCVELTALGVAAEVVQLELGDSWCDRAADLAAVKPLDQPLPLFVERAGSATARRVEQVLAELVVPPASDGASERLRRMSKVLTVMALLFETRTTVLEPGARRPRSRRSVFRSAVQRLASDSLEDVSLESFSSEVGLSPRQVSRLFRDELGTTFREYMVDLRLERAKVLLERTDDTIIDVAGATGWSSLAHFNAVFRRRVGATPSGYRASLAEAQPRPHA